MQTAKGNCCFSFRSSIKAILWYCSQIISYSSLLGRIFSVKKNNLFTISYFISFIEKKINTNLGMLYPNDSPYVYCKDKANVRGVCLQLPDSGLLVLQHYYYYYYYKSPSQKMTSILPNVIYYRRGQLFSFQRKLKNTVIAGEKVCVCEI